MSTQQKKGIVTFIVCDLCQKNMYRIDEIMDAKTHDELYYNSNGRDAHKRCVDKYLAINPTPTKEQQ